MALARLIEAFSTARNSLWVFGGAAYFVSVFMPTKKEHLFGQVVNLGFEETDDSYGLHQARD